MNPIELQMSFARAWLGAADAGTRSVANFWMLAGQSIAASMAGGSDGAKASSPASLGSMSLGMWPLMTGPLSATNPFAAPFAAMTAPIVMPHLGWLAMVPPALNPWSTFAMSQHALSSSMFWPFGGAGFGTRRISTPMDDVISAAYRTASGYAAAVVLTALQDQNLKPASRGWVWPMPTWPGNVRLH
jgi:hypothetical protein